MLPLLLLLPLMTGCAYRPRAVEVLPVLDYESTGFRFYKRSNGARDRDGRDRQMNNFVFVHREPAIFSVKAQEEGAHGWVYVEARVDAAGVVQELEITSKVHPLVEQAVRDATRLCTFARRFPGDERGGFEVRIYFPFGASPHPPEE